MKWFISAAFAALMLVVAAPVNAQDKPAQEQPAIDKKDVKKIRKAYGKLSAKVEVIRGELKGLINFKGKDKDLEAALKRLDKGIQEAKKECATIAEMAEAIEWSKAPKIAVRMSGEFDTLQSIAGDLKTKADLTTGLKNEMNQSARALKKDLKKLGNAPPIAAQ